jgi:hypothetical protein
MHSRADRADTCQCSLGLPQCSECRTRHTPCRYLQVALPSDRPAASPSSSKRKHEQLQAQSSDSLARVFALLRSQPADVAYEIFTQMRRGSDPLQTLRYIEYGSLRLQLMLVPDTTFQFTSPYLADMMPLFDGTDNPYLGSRLYKALSSESHATHHGVEIEEQRREAVYRVPYPSARIYDPRISPEQLKPSRWTPISSDDVFLTRLLEDYFLYEFPLWPCFHKDHFLDDMTAGNSDYCSPLLVNAILTAACHGLSILKHRSEFWNPRTYSYQCLAETRRLWEQEQSQAVVSLTSAQAATILGRIYFANGMDSMGWTTWCHAQALADKLELFEAKPTINSEKERVSRTITAWGIYSQQAYEFTLPLPLS